MAQSAHAPSPPPDGWLPPQEFEEYRLVRPVGRGRNGLVYLAHDTLLDRPVAVKFIPALDSAALARFLVEARAAARLQHPNVVTLYRVGQLDGAGYLVSEFVRGVSLDRVKKPAPWERVLEIGLDLARGLAAAHRGGVLHRDVKPGNAVLTTQGEVKLVDFGLAKLVGGPPDAAASAPTAGGPSGVAEWEATVALDGSLGRIEVPSHTPGELVGTPYFMSPEAWAGEELTTRSDVYSLGVVLYELCAGKGPFRDVPPAELATATRSRNARPLAEVLPGVDARFAAVIDRCVRRLPQERYSSAEELLDALEDVSARTSSAEVPEGNPYRGLQAFEAEHRALFFGRRRDIRTIIERLKAEPFLMVTGDSGVGKSSICLAGVLPAITDGALNDGRQWRVARLVPGRRPARALAETLARVLEEPEEHIAELLRDKPAGLLRHAKEKLGTGAGVILFVDQLEELVTLSDPAEAAAAGVALGLLSEGISGLKLLATARSDFLTRLTAVPGLGGTVPRAISLLRAMSAEEVREAIVGPARVKGVRYESEALVDTLVASTATAEGGLPLLQFALAELWEFRDTQALMIDAASLERIGGVTGALARHADAVVASLLPEQRSAARGVMLRLVTADGTRARKTDRELAGDDPRYRAALEALVRGRLLMAREAESATSYEVAHEALLAGWATLARWIAEAGERREIQARLETAAAHWERLGRARDVLWGQRQLAEAASLEISELPFREQEFLEASRRRVVFKRRMQRALAAAFVVCIGLVYVAVQVQQRLSLEGRVREQLEAAQKQLASSVPVKERRRAAREAAFGAYDAGKKAEGDAGWAKVEEASTELRQRYDAASEHFERALALANRPDTKQAFAAFLFERAQLAEEEHEERLLTSLEQRLQLYDDDGNLWRRWNEPAKVKVALSPPDARAVLRPIQKTGGRHVLGEPVVSAVVSSQPFEVPPGDYLLEVSAPGREGAVVPLHLTRGEQREERLSLFPKGKLPEGFVYIPAGTVLFGSSADPGVREFFNAAPMHPVVTGEFLIARHETTYADWIAFLEALAPGERAKRTPGVGENLNGGVELEQKNGQWQLRLRASTQPYEAAAGQKLRYQGRDRRAEQDWLRLPVSGISFHDAEAYAAWLSATGRVPGARLCTELEWERAARGADGREYPHGSHISTADEANIDITYNRTPSAFGPDEVGSHPASRSPFGVDDMAGNVWEWTRSSLEPGHAVVRGGAYYYNRNVARSENRELPEMSARDVSVGLRICAAVPRIP